MRETLRGGNVMSKKPFNDGYAIEVNDIKKSFKVYYDKGNQLKERMLFWKRNRYEKREVLKGISFNVRKGEAVGLIGHNGCGKSTTLKLLTRIIYPDEGSVIVRGRVSSLIELGAGFHPDMSGRENIYTNAAIFGLNRKEIEEKIDDIIRFSELEEFIDNPVRTYSSGMYMRLAFSVAINVDADVLLVDEILAVGDVNFQKKCFDKLKEIKEQGTTIVIVSHSLGQIEEICDRSIWIDDGKIREQGAPLEVHEKYLEVMEGERLIREQKEKEEIEKNREQQLKEIENEIDLEIKNMESDSETKLIDMSTLSTENGSYSDNDGIISDGRPGCVFYGPYMKLEEGRYTVTIIIKGLEGKTAGKVEIVSGDKTFARKNYNSSCVMKMMFNINEPTDGIEIRMFADKDNIVNCTHIGLKCK